MRKFVAAAVVGAFATVVSATGAGAYIRTGEPIATSVTCSQANGTVTVNWSKDANKPSYALVGLNSDMTAANSYAIANKLMSKASITVSYGTSPGQTIYAQVFRASNTGNVVVSTTC